MWKLLKRIFHKLYERIPGLAAQQSKEGTDKETAPVHGMPAHHPQEPSAKDASQLPSDPCRPILDLVGKTDGKPILLIGYYRPEVQEHPDNAIFSHLFLYPYSHKRSDLLVFTPSVCVKKARALADQLIEQAPAQKKYQMLLVAYPEASDCCGTPCGVLRLADDVTDEPLIFRPGEKLNAPKAVLQHCFRPDLRPYLKKGASSQRIQQRQQAPGFRTTALKTKDEIQIERWNRVLKQQRSNKTFQQDFIRTPLMDIAGESGGRPIILYGTFIAEKRPHAVRNCFRDIQPYFPDVPEYKIKVITDHLMIEDAGERAYSFGQIRQKTEKYGSRVLLIGYPYLYINKGFVRCGFRLAKNMGISAILYSNFQKNGRFILPDAVLAKCYLPSKDSYLKQARS